MKKRIALAATVLIATIGLGACDPAPWVCDPAQTQGIVKNVEHGMWTLHCDSGRPVVHEDAPPAP